jgi:hypothetical protein
LNQDENGAAKGCLDRERRFGLSRGVGDCERRFDIPNHTQHPL